jgi:phenylalanine-4-hydroxylase
VKENPGHLFKPRAQKRNQTKENQDLIPVYQKARMLREEKISGAELVKHSAEMLKFLDQKFPNEWLIRIEILELLTEANVEPQLCQKLRDQLKKIEAQSEKLQMLIKRGLELI